MPCGRQILLLDDLPPISLCMINWNGEQHLPTTLRAIARQQWPFAEFIIVDDGSSDSSRSIIRHFAPDAHLISLNRQLGPAGARNAAFAACRYDLALFIDNDVRLQADTTRRLLSRIVDRTEALLVTPRTVYEENPEIIQYDSADCHFLGLMAMRNAEQNIHAADRVPARTTSLSTGCFLIRRSIWGTASPFDESFGFNLEDHDFGVRSQLFGHELQFEPDALVMHGSGSNGFSYRPGTSPTDDRLFFLIRNRWFIIAKCFRLRTILLLAPNFFLFEVAQFAMLLVRGKSHLYIRAISSLLAKRHALLAKRADVQANRQRGDREILVAETLPFTGWVKSGSINALLVQILETILTGYWRMVRRWI